MIDALIFLAHDYWPIALGATLIAGPTGLSLLVEAWVRRD